MRLIAGFGGERDHLVEAGLEINLPASESERSRKHEQTDHAGLSISAGRGEGDPLLKQRDNLFGRALPKLDHAPKARTRLCHEKSASQVGGIDGIKDSRCLVDPLR